MRSLGANGDPSARGQAKLALGDDGFAGVEAIGNDGSVLKYADDAHRARRRD
jgi:hypothetical protein